MPAPRKINDQMRAEILEVGRKRKELRALPTTKELARKAGCSERAVQDVMYGRNVRGSEVSCESVRHGSLSESELDALLDDLPEDVRRGTFNDDK